MGYIRIDTGFCDHPTVLEIGPEAAMLFIAGMCYCSRFKTGGLIPRAIVPILHAEAAIRRPRGQVARLLTAGVWEQTPTGYQIINWLGCGIGSEDPPSPARMLWNRLRAKLAPQVYARDGYTCQYCGALNDLTVDHVVPLSRGGGNDLDNLVTACAPCNTAKSTRTIEEWC